MAVMQRESVKGEPGREYFAIVLEAADVQALAAGNPVQIRVGLPLDRAWEDSTFTLYRKSA